MGAHEHGVGAGCGVVKWALQLSKKCGGNVFKVGVSSEGFAGYSEWRPPHLWYFQDDCMYAPGWQLQGYQFNPPYPFTAGDVVTVELKRAPGVDGVMRVRVAGKIARELRRLPRDGVLYPIVGLCNGLQSISTVALP
jgi:hypothetical protein